MLKLKRYVLRSFDTLDHVEDLIQNYKKYLVRTDAICAYAKFSSKELNKAITKIIVSAYNKDSLVLRDRRVEAWARANDIKVVNNL